MLRIKQATPLSGYQLRLTLSDGSVVERDVDRYCAVRCLSRFAATPSCFARCRSSEALCAGPAMWICVPTRFFGTDRRRMARETPKITRPIESPLVRPPPGARVRDQGGVGGPRGSESARGIESGPTAMPRVPIELLIVVLSLAGAVGVAARVFASRGRSSGNRPRSINLLAGVGVGVLIAPFPLFLAIVSAGAGEGHYVFARLFFRTPCC